MSMIVGKKKKTWDTVDDQVTNHERTQHILDFSTPIHLEEFETMFLAPN